MFVALLILWLIFAGSLTVTNLILGVIVSALITLLCSRFMGYSSRKFLAGLKKSGQVLHYLLVLLREIVLANIGVLRVIYRKAEPEPNLVYFRTDVKSEALQVLVANSITLTPGTYTVKLEDGNYAVHALDAPFNDGMEDNVFFQMARKMEEA